MTNNLCIKNSGRVQYEGVQFIKISNGMSVKISNDYARDLDERVLQVLFLLRVKTDCVKLLQTKGRCSVIEISH